MSPSIITVAAYLEQLNAALYDQEAVVQGEISECRLHATGVYFALKDREADAVLNCYLYPRLYRELGVPLTDGMEVRVGGHPRMYVRKGSLSFQVASLELAGEGALKKAYELLRRQLEAEGLFARKRALPLCIRRVGVVTSRTGAVIDDFRKNLDRCGYTVVLYDTRVEGPQAVAGVLRGIRYFADRAAARAADAVDVIVVMRGGGSLEDLQAFNNEQVVRALFAAPIPTIAAIGHDRDVPLVTLVADSAPSTPTAAALLLNQSWRPVRDALARHEVFLLNRADQLVTRSLQRVEVAMRELLHRTSGLIERPAQLSRELIIRFERLLAATRADIRAYQVQLSGITLFPAIRARVLEYERYLGIVSPERTLRLGYSIVRDARGSVLRSATTVAAGDVITIRFADDELRATALPPHAS